ncbi:MAG: gliding motility protein GldM [Bacteroidales bacterium]|nr:gliding motility protein GldM [Bacteroidales bacterium]MCF8402687.1 gliding motility protein GldM [Bacteroidales bacterium]
MAGYKETPRQKMIAMMYLVLTALLALNVSKEILEAFIVVNESIDSTNEKFANKIETTYLKFQQQYELNPEKVGDEWEKAQKVKAYTKSIDKYIDSLKYEVIRITEGITFEEAKIINLADVKKKDNFDTPTNFFVSSDTKKGVGEAMVDSLNIYRERMLRIIDEDRRPQFDERLGLKTDGKYKNAYGDEQEWIEHNFYHTILAADVTIMNKIKAEIYNTESDIISYLYSTIDEQDFKFSELSAKVIPNSNYVFQGDDYEAEISVAAVDETQNPVVYILQNADTMTHNQIDIAERIEGERGVVRLTLPASSEGTRKYAGIIEMKDPTGLAKYYPFSQEYIVAKPSATISPTKMNVFYRGVDNPVAISASGKANSQLKINISDGKITQTDTGWVVTDLPPEAYETTIRVNSDDGKFLGEQLFRVKRLPDPIARVIGADEDGKISKKRMLTNPFLVCQLPDYVDFKYDFKVNSFTMIVPTRGGGQYVSTEKSETMMFTDKMKNLVESLGKDEILIFQDIKVRGPEGPRKIKSINITIQ